MNKEDEPWKMLHKITVSSSFKQDFPFVVPKQIGEDDQTFN